MSEYDDKNRRLECLKLAQGAAYSVNSMGQSYCSGMEDVVDRAVAYASFVNGPDNFDFDFDDFTAEVLFKDGSDTPPMTAKEMEAWANVELQRHMQNQEQPQSVSVPLMDFSTALDDLKDGEKIARAGWNNPQMWLVLQTYSGLDPGPGIFLAKDVGTIYGAIVPWVASQSDLLAEDWYIV